MNYKLVIFDLDGTVLDTLDDLADSVNYALKKNNLPLRSLQEIRSFVGNGIRLLIERSVPENCSGELTDKVFSVFKHHYKDNSCNKTKPYEGVYQLLKSLKDRGVYTAVVSNKADFAVRDIVARYFDGMFDYYVGEKEGVPRKPAPDSVYETIRFFNVYKKDVVYIGDSEVDIDTAKNAGVECLCVCWGFRDKSVLLENGADIIFDNAYELENYLK